LERPTLFEDLYCDLITPEIIVDHDELLSNF